MPGTVAANGASKPDKAAKSDENTASKSPSDYGLFGRRTGAGNSRRVQSQSGGNVPVIAAVPDNFTDLHGISSEAFDVVVRLVDALLTLDCRVDTWRSVMSSSWRRVIDTRRDKKTPSRLKSNLAADNTYLEC